MRIVLPLLLTTCLLVATEGRAQTERSRKATADTTDAVVSWLASNALRLETVEAGSGFDDMQGLREIVGDARLVLLGEPTHGNREVFQLKHRMVEFLVEEMGFNVFAFETPMPESFDVEAYVSDGVGDAASALAAAHVSPFDSDEVADMLRWMRRHNATSTQPLAFYGFDIQSPERAAVGTLAYLDRVDPALAVTARAGFGHLAIPFSDPDMGGYRPVLDRDSDEPVQKTLGAVLAAFEENREAWAVMTGADDLGVARQHARVLGQWVEANRDGGRRYGAVRDSSMAENIRWIIEREGPDAKAVVWAHNAHVSDAQAAHRSDGTDWAGRHIRRMFGDEAVIVGFLFNQGGFTALDAANSFGGMRTFTVGPAPPETIEARFAGAGLRTAVADLRRLPSSGAATEWFRTPRPSRFSWGEYDLSTPEAHITLDVLPEAFDVLAYVDTTTPTRLVEPADYGAFPVLAAPVNLDFEHGVVGEAPAGWVVWSKLRRYGFEVATTDAEPYQGRRAAAIRRAPGDAIGEASGSVIQRIDAAPYQGQRVRLRAAARSEVAGKGLAFLRLRFHPPETGSSLYDPTPLFDSLDEHRVRSDEWRVYEIVADVPEGAGLISYGLFLAGSGAAWLDAVSVEVVEE